MRENSILLNKSSSWWCNRLRYCKPCRIPKLCQGKTNKKWTEILRYRYITVYHANDGVDFQSSPLYVTLGLERQSTKCSSISSPMSFLLQTGHFTEKWLYFYQFSMISNIRNDTVIWHVWTVVGWKPIDSKDMSVRISKSSMFAMQLFAVSCVKWRPTCHCARIRSLSDTQ
jgi:hypothetical protein